MKFVITGGPGAGKTSSMIALERLCAEKPESYGFVREVAEDLIKYFKKKGHKEPQKQPYFQHYLLKMQKQRESTLPKEGISFIDRGIPDAMAYTTDSIILERLLEDSRKAAYASLVFYMEPMQKNYEITKVREESFEESLELGQKLKNIYTELGYKVVNIAPAELEERAESILETARSYWQEHYETK